MAAVTADRAALGEVPSVRFEVVLGGRKVAIRRPRARRAGEEVPLPTARGHSRMRTR